jgi:hypothetical protein
LGRDKRHFLEPEKTCGFAPYLIFMIKDVTNRSFPKDEFHMPMRINPTKKTGLGNFQNGLSKEADT